MLYAGTKPGRINAQTVFSKPNPLTTRYVGINPPLKNIVKTINPVQNPLCGKYFLDKGYAVKIIAITINGTPIPTLFSVFINPYPTYSLENTLRYGDKLKSRGIKLNVAKLDDAENDCEIKNKNGYKQDIQSIIRLV